MHTHRHTRAHNIAQQLFTVHRALVSTFPRTKSRCVGRRRGVRATARKRPDDCTYVWRILYATVFHLSYFSASSHFHALSTNKRNARFELRTTLLSSFQLCVTMIHHRRSVLPLFLGFRVLHLCILIRQHWLLCFGAASVVLVRSWQLNHISVRNRVMLLQDVSQLFETVVRIH